MRITKPWTERGIYLLETDERNSCKCARVQHQTYRSTSQRPADHESESLARLRAAIVNKSHAGQQKHIVSFERAAPTDRARLHIANLQHVFAPPNRYQKERNQDASRGSFRNNGQAFKRDFPLKVSPKPALLPYNSIMPSISDKACSIFCPQELLRYAASERCR